MSDSIDSMLFGDNTNPNNTLDVDLNSSNLIDFTSPKINNSNDDHTLINNKNDTVKDDNDEKYDLNFEDLDCIEVTSNSIDSEDFWLCDPKSVKNGRKQTNLHLQISNQQIPEQENQNRKSINNPYRWIMEEFEDKNLDKVKRALLVTLDDISKGLDRRSRSVSNTRTPLSNYSLNNNLNLLHQNINDKNNNNQKNFIQFDDELRKLAAEVIAATNELSANGKVQLKTNELEKLNNENMKNEQEHLFTKTNTKTTNSPIESADIKCSTINSSNYEIDKQYEDITDVRVIAKIQEENLRKSVLNINKSKSLCNSVNSLVNYTNENTNLEQNNNNNNKSNELLSSKSSNISTNKKSSNCLNNYENTSKTLIKQNEKKLSLPSNDKFVSCLDDTCDTNYVENGKLSRSNSLSSDQSISSNSNESFTNSNYLNVNAFFWDDDFMPSNAEIPFDDESYDDFDSSDNSVALNNSNNDVYKNCLKMKANLNENTDEQLRQIDKLLMLSKNENDTKRIQQIKNTITAKVSLIQDRNTTANTVKHVSRLPTPRAGRITLKTSVSNDKINENQIDSKILTTPAITPNTMLTKNKPPIPNSNTNTNQIRHNSVNTNTITLKKPVQNPINQIQPQQNNIQITKHTNGKIMINNTNKGQIQINKTTSPNLLTPPTTNSNGNSRGTSPNLSVNNSTIKCLPSNIISPSGLLTDGPLNRKSSISPSRLDRSKSPGERKNSLQPIKESKIPNPISTPIVTNKQSNFRRSLLPQPQNLTLSALRKPSISPMRGQFDI